MSDNISERPTLPPDPDEGGAAGGGSGAAGKRTAIIGGVSIAVLAVLGAGAYAAVNLMGGGSQPAEALPDTTVGLVSLDLDPSADQKVEAIKTLRKFPDVEKNLDVESDTDLRKYVFDKLVDDSDCKKLDYEDDIKPWIGERVALGAVGNGKKSPSPVIALQVEDAGKAKKGVEKIIDCGDTDDDFGYAFNDDYLILSDGTKEAKSIAADAKKSPLSDDATYKKWTDAVGDPGVVSFYMAPEAAGLIADEIGGFDDLIPSPDSLTDVVPGTEPGADQDLGTEPDLDTDQMAYTPGSTGPARSGTSTEDDGDEAVKKAMKDFKGAAGTIRFADGGMEMEFVGGGAKKVQSGAKVGKAIENLPKDTALVLGVGVPGDFAKTMLDGVESSLGSLADKSIGQAETELGVELPDDLQTLLGKAVTLSIGGDAPESVSDIKGPSDLPVGLRITGDPDEIKGVIAKIEQRTGHTLEELQVKVQAEGDHLVLSPSGDYADSLLKDGALGDNGNFKSVVPEADKSTAVFYIDFDTKWRETLASLAEGFGGPDLGDSIRDNSDPLEALGISAWLDGEASHVLVKLTTD